jgi:hypothetical protein
MPHYFEVFYHYHNNEEFYSNDGKYPFPLLSNREEVTIDGTRYMVMRREQVRGPYGRNDDEITVNYLVTPVNKD